MKDESLELIPEDVGLSALLDESTLSAVKFITSDSREVDSQSIFVAVRGARADGHQFIEEALAKGALWVVGQDVFHHPRYTQVPNSRRALSWLLAASFDFPTRDFQVYGVTGTSGKTTTAFLLESILRCSGKKTALIGTVECRIGDQVLESSHTTPSPEKLHQMTRQMKTEGVDALVMEVSSHGLDQHRSDGIAWDVVGFLNLSPEHLDYHHDMDSYFEAKAHLFRSRALEARVLGKKTRGFCVVASESDDDWGQKMVDRAEVSSEAVRPRGETSERGFETIEFDGESIETRLMGAFNRQNASLAAAMTKAGGVESTKIKQGIEQLPGVPGRMEVVDSNQDQPVVLVDYAHKSEALEKVLQGARALVRSGQKLRVVFGCGGDRDREKRPEMGKIAERLADWVCVTSDNPRTEHPRAIIDEILAGMKAAPAAVVEDRRVAIHQAIEASEPGDVVLIAGKGHETYQIIGTEKHDFDDRAVAREALST
jgi:UDP-N-acetylmuramoyl-L-alanyl-D-glutamate--2,6-diaminopimelate ligase